MSTNPTIPLGSSPGSRRRGGRAGSVALRLTLASYATDTLLLVAFVVIGAIPAAVPFWYALCGIGHGLIFGIALRGRISARHRDVNFTVWQNLYAFTVQLVFLAVAPPAGLLFVTVLFVIFAFGALSLTRRETGFTMAALVAGIIVVMMTSTGFAPYAPTDPIGRLLNAAIVILGLSRCLTVGLWTTSLRRKLDEKNLQLAVSLKEVHRLATTDPLTGILNRRSLMQTVEAAENPEYVERALCVAMLDLDHFKAVNDRFGHLVGDVVLKKFAEIVASAVSEADSVGRFGGEEFLIVLQGASVGEAASTLDRIRSSVRNFDWDALAPGLRLTVSIGAAHQQSGHRPVLLLGRADVALYQAKNCGRDRVEMAAAPS